jgi:hypothetical protein
MQTKLAFLFVALVLIAGGLTRWWLAPEEVMSTEVHCDLSQGYCQITTAEGEMSLSVSPSPFKVMSAHKVMLNTAQSVFIPESLEVTGVNMEMGLTKVDFRSAGVQAWAATLMLPICTQSEMTWRFLLKGRSRGRPQAFHWELTTQR